MKVLGNQLNRFEDMEVDYHLAQACERKGEIDRSRTYYGQFLQVWSAAEAGTPQVIDAKRRLVILGQ